MEGGGGDGAFDVEVHEGEDDHGGEDDADNISEKEKKGTTCNGPVESGESHTDDGERRDERNGDGDAGDGIAHVRLDTGEGDGKSGDESDGEIDE